MLPFFEVVLVADDDDLYLIMGVVLDFEEPLVETFEGIPFGQVEHQEGCDRRLVVGTRDRLEGFLAGLRVRRGTVSQICILMV